MPYPPYPNNDQLYGTMISFGEYQLSYLPPEKGIEGRITMTISSEAELDQMLEIFLNFLRASGYYISPSATLEINDNKPKRPVAQRLEDAYFRPRHASDSFTLHSTDGSDITKF